MRRGVIDAELLGGEIPQAGILDRVVADVQRYRVLTLTEIAIPYQ